MAVNSVEWQYWSSGWTDASSSQPDPQHSAIGPEDGDSRYRTCLTVNLGALGSAEKRSKLKIVLSLYKSNGYLGNWSYDDITANWYTQGPTKSKYQPQGTLVDTKVTTGYFSSSIYFDVAFEFDISGLDKTAHTLYFYFTSQKKTTGSYHVFKFQSSENTSTGQKDSVITEITAVDYTPVVTGAISTSGGQIFKPTQSITFSWSKATGGDNNNKLSAYEPLIEYYVNSQLQRAYLSTNTTTNLSATISISNADRNTSVVAYVKAHGSKDYDGGWKSKTLGTINKLPTISKIQQSTNTEVTNDKSVSFTLTGSTNDTSQNTPQWQYNLNKTGWKNCSATLTIDKSFELAKNNTIVFRLSDGLENSNESDEYSFTSKFKPVITSSNITFSPLADRNGATTSGLTNQINISFSADSTISKVKVELLVSSSSSFTSTKTVEEIVNVSSNSVALKVSSISETNLGKGQYFKVRFKVISGGDESEYNSANWSSYARRPLAPVLPTNIAYDVLATRPSAAKANYFGSKIKFTAKNPSQYNGYAAINSLKIIGTQEDGNPVEIPLKSTLNSDINETIDFSEDINPGSKVTFKIEITDAIGQITSSEIATLTRTDDLKFIGTNIEVIPNNIRPLDNTSVITINHPFASASGSNSIEYKYHLQVVDSAYLTNVNISPNTTTNIITATISPEDFKTQVQNLVIDRNIAYKDRVLTVVAIDAFGKSISKSFNSLTINFTEPPYFIRGESEGGEFKIKHDFVINKTTLARGDGYEVAHNSSVDLKMVNKGEGIIFMLPKADDKNGDFAGYEIFLFRVNMSMNDDGSINQPASYDNFVVTKDDNPWLVLPKESLTTFSDDANYYYYRHSVSQLSKNEFLYFQVRAYDSTGNTSEIRRYKSNLIGCRVSAPVFGVDTDVSRHENGKEISVDYRITMQDLGGSATANGWNNEFYRVYKNFERAYISNEYPNSPRKVRLTIEISGDSAFSNKEVYGPVETTINTNDSLLNYVGENPVYQGKSRATFAVSEIPSKIYMRFIIQIAYGYDSSGKLVYTDEGRRTDANLGEIPTVSHRSHQVGINTNQLDDSVFAVDSYGSKTKIRFTGMAADDASKFYTVILDLSTRKIDGIIIDCGSW